jgi:hypothetical protein
VKSRGERERERTYLRIKVVKMDKIMKRRGSTEHKLTLVSLHYKGIPRIEEEYHGIYQIAH